MRKILVFYGSYGGGHLSAAKAICGELEDIYGNDIEVKMVDCIEYINKYVNRVSTEAYKELAKKAPWAWKQVYNQSKNGALSHISTATNRLMALKLNSLLQDFKPDLIISTHPFATQMCAVLKKRKKITCKLATILTDYHIHPQWLVFYQYVDSFFVSNEQMKLDMINEGVDKDKIFVTGIPVSERFSGEFNDEEIYKEFGLNPEKPVVLFFAGGEFGLGRNTTYMVLKALIRLFKDLQVVAISGRNKKMNKKFKDLVEITKSSDRVKIIEFSNKIPELMHIAMGVITKPGGLTITEALVSHLPVVVINPIPGQEEENAEFLVSNNVAIWIKKGDNIARSLKYLSRDVEKIRLMSLNAAKLAKPKATADICKILVDEFDDVVKVPNQIIVSALIKHEGKYLFIKQSKENEIHLVSGALDKNEAIENAIKRHALEEVNLKLDTVTPFDFDNDTIDYNGRAIQLIFLRYTSEVTDISSITKNSDEKEILWLSKEELKNYNYDNSTKNFLEKLKLLK